jgi:DNA-binding transcriptional MerR regulator
MNSSLKSFKKSLYNDGELTTAEAATAIGIHKKTLLDWIMRGWMPDPERNRLMYRIWTQEHIDLGRKILTSNGPYSPK